MPSPDRPNITVYLSKENIEKIRKEGKKEYRSLSAQAAAMLEAVLKEVARKK